MFCSMEYTFGQFGSAVQIAFPLNFLPTSSLLTEEGWGAAGWEKEKALTLCKYCSTVQPSQPDPVHSASWFSTFSNDIQSAINNGVIGDGWRVSDNWVQNRTKHAFCKSRRFQDLHHICSSWCSCQADNVILIFSLLRWLFSSRKQGERKFPCPLFVILFYWTRVFKGKKPWVVAHSLKSLMPEVSK